jgi:AcrR family transcriptional regulator
MVSKVLVNATRLRRPQMVERNREQLLAAARRVFLERGFHAATLDAIAEAAGFSKGVVYSQFDSKADLFLALLERRIEERAAENARLAASTTSVVGLIDAARRTSEAEPAWNLLLLEFRVHAARIPEVNARYAALHERTKQRLAAALRAASGDAIARSDVPPETMAAFVLAFAAGVSLEELVAPLALAQDEPIRRMVTRALGVADDRRSPAISRGRAPRAAARGRRAR